VKEFEDWIFSGRRVAIATQVEELMALGWERQRAWEACAGEAPQEEVKSPPIYLWRLRSRRKRASCDPQGTGFVLAYPGGLAGLK
jgi:hypothetical protein